MRKRTILLNMAILYVLCLAAWLSSRHLMVLDEFFAWNLLSDRSFQHAIGSWRQGADSGGILYYVLLWPLVRLSHGSVLVARLFSALCYALAAAVWWRTLRRFLDSRAAALGVLLVWSSTELVLVYIAQVRFYAPFLLFAALAVWATLYATDEKAPAQQAVVLIFLAHAGLVLIHMLGIFYSAMIVGACFLCLPLTRRSMLVGSAAIASWLTLLPCWTAIRNGSANATSQTIPVFRDVLRFYLKASTNAAVLLVAFLGLIWLLRDRLSRSTALGSRSRIAFRGPVLCLAFAAAPFCLYLIAHLGRPLGQGRYLLPYYLSLCTLCAYAFARRGTAAGSRLTEAVLSFCLAAIVGLHIWALKALLPGPSLHLGDLPQRTRGIPVVVADEQTFFELQYYRSNPSLQFHFLLPPAKSPPSGMMATVAERGYFPHSFDHIDVFQRSHPEFFFIASSVPGSSPWVTHDPTCHTHPVGSVVISGVADAVYDVVGCQWPPQASSSTDVSKAAPAT